MARRARWCRGRLCWVDTRRGLPAAGSEFVERPPPRPPRRAVVAGAAGARQIRSLLQAIHAVYQPNKVVLGTTGPVEPFARTLPSKDGPVVYLCTGTPCQPPTAEPRSE